VDGGGVALITSTSIGKFHSLDGGKREKKKKKNKVKKSPQEKKPLILRDEFSDPTTGIGHD